MTVGAIIVAALGALAAFFNWRRERVPKGVSTEKISEVHDAIRSAEAGDTAGIDRAISEL